VSIRKRSPRTDLSLAAADNNLAQDMTEESAADGRTARRDRNRLVVLDAVLELFAAGDLAPTPEAVAQRSGLSLRSVYRYVNDREDLVYAAIERHLERVGPLLMLDPASDLCFDDRVAALVAARLRLYEAVAPTARAAVLRTKMTATPASEIIRKRLVNRRGLLRIQLSRQFAAELAALGPLADPVLAAADGLTQLETIDWFIVDGGYNLEQTRDALVVALRLLLGTPGAAAAPGWPPRAAAEPVGAAEPAAAAEPESGGAGR